ncbi:hypothetical protein BC936DRAFT_145090 [Jimgerdemannia flammicorona]|uniref:OBG-type G domain-containing protein n=1 Tax=Jimgerdemannia flammicorona TaxID=994334 RepID=A0A433DAZ5_9FUNG|nr:hypothetical protein BC936DRAFT_145090 [Jimgerdemannia flammicorona]
MARTQKNKATEYHLGLLKAKIAKYRTQLLESSKTKSEKGEGFDVMKSGDARVALIGFPSVGKSTLLSKLTKTESAVASYEFTTLTCIPGKIEYNGASIQLLDLPGIIEGAAQGKGRGKQVIAVARTADLVLMMLDATKSHQQRVLGRIIFVMIGIFQYVQAPLLQWCVLYSRRALLEAELEAVGIRLNRKRPNVYFKVKKGGGLSFNATCKLTHFNEKMVYHILHDYKIFNAEVLIREDITVDEFIDVVLGNRKYITCIYCYNKIDQITIEEVDRLAREPYTVVVSCEADLNLDYLLEQIWKHLNLVRVYTKKRGEYPDFDGGLIIRNGATIEHVCHAVHRSLVDNFRFALVWVSVADWGFGSVRWLSFLAIAIYMRVDEISTRFFVRARQPNTTRSVLG